MHSSKFFHKENMKQMATVDLILIYTQDDYKIVCIIIIMKDQEERVCAIYFDRINIGISLYTSKTLRLQCSAIYNICSLTSSIMQPILKSSSLILSNNLTHQLLCQLEAEGKVLAVSEKSLEYDIIEHNLTRISKHISSLNNPKVYFKKMAENSLKFKSLGMVLFHLLNQISFSQKPKLYFEDIEYFNDTLFQSVSYGKGQLQFLQITKEDIHPSLIKGKGASKEGYSVISAYQAYLTSTGSKRILRHIFLNPTYNASILQQRYGNIQWMKYYMKDSIKFAKYFSNIHVVETIVKKFEKMNAQQTDWKKLMRTLEAMLQIRKLISFKDAPKIVEDYLQNPNWSELIEMFNIFNNTLDFNPLSVRSGIDQALDQLKQTYDNMPHILTLIAKDQQWGIDNFRIVFMAQVGYLIKLESETQLPQDFDSDDWVLQFSNSSGRYYANSLTQNLDQQYGDIFGQIQDIQKKILFDMQALIVERSNTILNLYWKICQIECYWGISQLSKNMCRPTLSSESLIIANGWHMLLAGNIIHNNGFSFCQSQAPKQQVYNSEQNLVNMNYSNRCMMLTGPNASGKTIYMKQIGVIMYLAHLGFFVPASLAQIPLIDSILFIGKSESIYNQQQCGFYSELQSLSSITQPSIVSNKSLILIDELGSQIDYQSSLKLMYATINYLTSKNQTFSKNRLLTRPKDQFGTPLVIFVTHLSQILTNKIIEENYMIRFLTMAVEQEGLRLFKIKPGLVAKGYGIKTASEIMPQNFISLSKNYLRLIGQQ